jgi:hypothetical protein
MKGKPEGIATPQESGENLSIEEIIERRIAAHSPQPEEETEAPETEDQPEQVDETEPEDTEEPETEETDEEEGEAEIDLLSLSPEQIQDLAKRGKSRLLHRIGELTAQKKALEEKIQTAQAESKPLPVVPDEENPFRDIKSLDEVKSKYGELEKVLEETDRILEDHEDYGPDDIIDFGGKEFTKKQIRQANRNARNSLTKYLPAQAASIQRSEHMQSLAKQYEEAIQQEVPEVLDESSTIYKQYVELKSDPLVQQVRDRVPDLEPQLDYILAHAVRSINLKAAKKATAQPATGTPVKARPPADPFGAGTARTVAPVKKKIAEAEARFQSTGSQEDWIAARIAKLSKT